MTQEFRTDIIIPARGGSKGLPRKNVFPLGGKPLIAWSIEAARQANLKGRIVVSTDDQEIAEVSEKYGAQVPYYRPANISDEFSHPVYAVLHDLDWCEEHKLTLPDFVVMLLPTSPFRTGKDIANVVQQLTLQEKYQSIISVYDCSGLIRAIRKLSEDGFLKPLDEISALGKHLRRQEMKGFYVINGIYASRPKCLREHKTFIGHEKVGHYLMNNLSAVDIDTEEDLHKAEHLLPLFLQHFEKNLPLLVA